MKTAVFVFSIASLLSANLWAINVETVPVGNPGNANDSDTGRGSVAYKYRIGKFEVTNFQYVEFLNAVDQAGANTLALYSSSMMTDPTGGISLNPSASNGEKYNVKLNQGNRPVVYVSWYDSLRFANWLENGQGSAGTESGSYSLAGGEPIPPNGHNVARNPGAKWVLPSQDEWYKAAYHKNGGVSGNYWDYPTSRDVAPDSDKPPGSNALVQSNTANIYRYDNIDNAYNRGFAVTAENQYFSSKNYLADVGAYPLSASPYGTFDQAGSVFEWNEGLHVFSNSFYREYRGGAWNFTEHYTNASEYAFNAPGSEAQNRGFRVAYIVPEPATLLMAALVGLATLAWRRIR